MIPAFLIDVLKPELVVLPYLIVSSYTRVTGDFSAFIVAYISFKASPKTSRVSVAVGIRKGIDVFNKDRIVQLTVIIFVY